MALPLTTPSLDVGQAVVAPHTHEEADWLSGRFGRLFVWSVIAAPFVLHLFLPLPCPMKVTTGLDCPGCGGTRASEAVVSGRWGTAVHDDLLVLVLPVLAIAYLVVKRLWPTSNIWKIDRFWLLVAILVAWTVVRNLPGLNMLQAPS